MPGVDLFSVLRQRRKKRLLRLAGVYWFFFIRNYHTSTRSIWTREWLLRRRDYGVFDTLLSELRAEDQASFLNFLRVSPAIYDSLLDKVSPLIQKNDTPFRKSISPSMRLAVTLRFLATGTKNAHSIILISLYIVIVSYWNFFHVPRDIVVLCVLCFNVPIDIRTHSHWIYIQMIKMYF